MFVHSNHMDGPSLNMIHLVHISHRLGRQLVGFEIFLIKPRRKRSTGRNRVRIRVRVNHVYIINTNFWVCTTFI